MTRYDPNNTRKKSQVVTLFEGGAYMERFFRCVLIGCMLMVLLGLGVSLQGCSGGGAKVQSQTSTTTLGQELMDLEAAYKKGVITEKEYERAKKEILRKYDK